MASTQIWQPESRSSSLIVAPDLPITIPIFSAGTCDRAKYKTAKRRRIQHDFAADPVRVVRRASGKGVRIPTRIRWRRVLTSTTSFNFPAASSTPPRSLRYGYSCQFCPETSPHATAAIRLVALQLQSISAGCGIPTADPSPAGAKASRITAAHGNTRCRPTNEPSRPAFRDIAEPPSSSDGGAPLGGTTPSQTMAQRSRISRRQLGWGHDASLQCAAPHGARSASSLRLHASKRPVGGNSDHDGRC